MCLGSSLIRGSWCTHLVGVLCFDGVLPVGVCGRAAHGQQAVAQIDRLLILRGGRGRGGAEVQGSAQAVLRHLPIRGPTIWGVPTRSQHLRGGQGRQPVGTAALRGVVIWRRGGSRRTGRRRRDADELSGCLSSAAFSINVRLFTTNGTLSIVGGD